MKDWHFTAGAQQSHFQNRLSCSFSGFICSVHLRLESSEPHLTGARVFQRHQRPPWLELGAGKRCATFGLSGGDMQLCHQDKNQDTHTRTHTCVLQHAQNMFSVGLPQTSDFCQRCRLKCCWRGSMRWRLCHLLLTGVMFLPVLKMWRKWVDGGREGRRDWCWLHQEEAGSDASPCSCSQTPTLFLLECVCVHVCLLFVYRFSVSLPLKGLRHLYSTIVT